MDTKQLSEYLTSEAEKNTQRYYQSFVQSRNTIRAAGPAKTLLATGCVKRTRWVFQFHLRNHGRERIIAES